MFSAKPRTSRERIERNSCEAHRQNLPGARNNHDARRARPIERQQPVCDRNRLDLVRGCCRRGRGTVVNSPGARTRRDDRYRAEPSRRRLRNRRSRDVVDLACTLFVSIAAARSWVSVSGPLTGTGLARSSSSVSAVTTRDPATSTGAARNSASVSGHPICSTARRTGLSSLRARAQTFSPTSRLSSIGDPLDSVSHSLQSCAGCVAEMCIAAENTRTFLSKTDLAP